MLVFHHANISMQSQADPLLLLHRSCLMLFSATSCDQIAKVIFIACCGAQHGARSRGYHAMTLGNHSLAHRNCILAKVVPHGVS